MIVGFTGTQEGMTDLQRGTVERFLRAWHVLAFEHGDCIGSDEQADEIAVRIGLCRVLRPCTIESKRAHCDKAHGGRVLKVYDPIAPLARNDLIVRDAHIMLATPKGSETLRSGTWATIRRARAARKHLIIIYPSGQLRHEGI